MSLRSNLVASLIVLTIMAISCSSGGNDNEAAPTPNLTLSDCVDGQWELQVDRAWNGMSGNISLPADQFTEDDYQPVSSGAVYLITISHQTSNVAVGSPPMLGSLVTKDDARMVYDLDEGTFAGGRLAIWAGNRGLQAELTIYGSGRPIISSERGSLTLKP